MTTHGGSAELGDGARLWRDRSVPAPLPNVQIDPPDSVSQPPANLTQPPGDGDGGDPAEVLRYPSATTVTLLLLITLLLLAGVFVGNMLYLGSPDAVPGALPPPLWLALPPAIAAAATLALTLVAPYQIERRSHLVDVPADVGADAVSRVSQLAAAAGVRPAPRLMWDPQARGALAMAYGRPGRYRLSVTPALVGAARRRPAAFDTVARHELAHVSHHDVVLAYAAVNTWYAVVPLLLLPVVQLAFHSQWSMLFEYLVRAAVLALIVYLVRAALLRSRELEADLRAASWSQHPESVAALLAVADPGTAGGGAAPGANRQRVASWFALHPSPSRRAEIVRRPALFGRPHAFEFLTAGLLAGAAMLLITQLVLSLGGFDIVQSDRIARSLVFAGLGAYAGASLVRAAGTGNLLGRTSLLVAAATVVGVIAGYLGSIERTGLVRFAVSDAVTVGVTALLAGGAVVVLTADLVREHPPRSAAGVAAVVLFCATAGALAANATLAVSQLAGNGVLGLFREELPSALVGGHAAHALGLLVLAAAIVALLAVRPWGEALVVPVLTGAFAGLIATAWMIGVHLRTGTLAGDDAKVRFYYACVWLGVAASVAVAMACAAGVRGRTPSGIIAGAMAATVASAGFVAGFEAPIELGGVLRMLAFVGGVATVIGLPLAALVSGMVPAARRPTSVPQPLRVRPGTVTAAVLLTAVATALVVGLVPRAVAAAPPTPGGDVSLTTYLRSDMPKIAGPHDAAAMIASEPSATPQSRRERLLDQVLPLYDSAAAAAAQVPGRSELVQTLNDAALVMLRAERAAFAAEADLILTGDQADVLALSVASARAQEAQIRWQQALAVAKATGSSGS